VSVSPATSCSSVLKKTTEASSEAPWNWTGKAPLPLIAPIEIRFVASPERW
jgi:hypothetical protein